MRTLPFTFSSRCAQASTTCISKDSFTGILSLRTFSLRKETSLKFVTLDGVSNLIIVNRGTLFVVP